ncbi:tautomerase [Longispora fulva]|uniref:Phenylpyruvate tautomerase PptA (4-oxalocrotonate tautomerase family) n=1 Tax=Longispora fulva TaxID=619741 RepID=A0A8J7GIR3_9ACTN|nr:tautomerase family protein [Longispora fulva]MBG6138836.1 phenylpyruvate tautomerase PptA (4-oxalocrotonate tautomerase family) [Longispora fulva]GIG58330.1 tautomerase [Longispora fulva]
MPQVKIYAHATHLATARTELSDTVHSCIVDGLSMPESKKFQRFIPLAAGDFVFPEPRTDRYTIIEVSMFEGRSVEAKKTLIRLLFERLGERCGLAPDDVEITLFETPASDWGIRGLPGDELTLNYPVNV